MIFNYLKLAWRNLKKYKLISGINLLGLTVGITCCLLILAFILFELSFDRSSKNAENIYRVTRSFNSKDGVQSLNLATISPPFGVYLPADFPEIQKITRLLQNGNLIVKYDEKIFNESDVYFADGNIFDFFPVELVKGSRTSALNDPFFIMLSEDVAQKYFGDDDPLNRIVRVNNQFDAKVSGVYKSLPANSHIHPRILVSFNTLKDENVYGEENLRTNWGNNSFFTYIMLPPGYDTKKMLNRFPAFLDKHMASQYGGTQPSKLTSLDLQKLTDIHLYSHTDFEAEANGDMTRVYIFAAIALFILLIACINYMNLSTARSALRAKEIGIRKVIGARKKELVLQFLSESVLLCWISILLSFGLLHFALQWLNKILDMNLSVQILMTWQVLIPLIVAPFIIGIVSGLYPAVFLSAFQPVKTLKGLMNVKGNSISLRKALVVSQFAISIILIIVTGVVFQQLRFLRNTRLGYDKEQVVTLLYNNSLSTQFDAFRNELIRNPAVKDAGRSSRVPTGRLLDASGASVFQGDSLQPISTTLKYVAADHDFIPTYGIDMAAGRNFSRDFGTDTAGFILNQASVKALGWNSDQEAIGRDFAYAGQRGKIIGVMKDFHFESLHQKIVPMILLLPPSSQNGFYNFISVKLTGNIPAGLDHLRTIWTKYQPEIPFEYNFTDDSYNNLYQAEMKQSKIFTVFSIIAIVIACLGLFGLSAFTISQRIKEIGIRKVLGADTGTIVALLSKDFLKLVGVAAIIAFPVAWYAMSTWLEDFAYRTNIHWWLFLLAGVIAAFISLITVSFQAIKAALMNPVKSLRSE